MDNVPRSVIFSLASGRVMALSWLPLPRSLLEGTNLGFRKCPETAEWRWTRRARLDIFSAIQGRRANDENQEALWGWREMERLERGRRGGAGRNEVEAIRLTDVGEGRGGIEPTPRLMGPMRPFAEIRWSTFESLAWVWINYTNSLSFNRFVYKKGVIAREEVPLIGLQCLL